MTSKLATDTITDDAGRDKSAASNARLPSAAEAAGISNKYKQKFAPDREKIYTNQGDTGKDDQAPSPARALDKKKLKELLQLAVKNFDDEEYFSEEGAQALEQVFTEKFPKLMQRFQAACARYDVPQWADRDRKARKPDGSRITPIDWIRMHYGRTLEDGSWDSDGLSRSRIRRLDKSLYQAFSTQLLRLKKQDKPIPEHLSSLVATSSDLVDLELEQLGICKPEDVYKLFPNDEKRTERIRSALRRRKLKVDH